MCVLCLVQFCWYVTGPLPRPDVPGSFDSSSLSRFVPIKVCICVLPEYVANYRIQYMTCSEEMD